MSPKEKKTTDSSAAVKIQVPPYPISVEVLKTEGAPPIKGNIVKLTDFGFLMRSDSPHIYKVGEDYFVRFILPASDHMVRSDCKVVKTYDAIDQIVEGQKKKIYTIEMHFRGLDDGAKTNINNYLVRSGQKKPL